MPRESGKQPQFDDSCVEGSDSLCAAGFAVSRSQNLENPWPTGAVKALRRTFEVQQAGRFRANLRNCAGRVQTLRQRTNVLATKFFRQDGRIFDERVMYQAYDVTANVKAGKNAIAACCWRRAGTPHRCSGSGRATTTARRRRRCERNCESNTKMARWTGLLPTNRGRPTISPILTAEIYDGETYDARKAASRLGYGLVLTMTMESRRRSLQPLRTGNCLAIFPADSRGKDSGRAKDVSSPSSGRVHFRLRTKPFRRAANSCQGPGGHRREVAIRGSAESRRHHVRGKSANGQSDRPLHPCGQGN